MMTVLHQFSEVKMMRAHATRCLLSILFPILLCSCAVQPKVETTRYREGSPATDPRTVTILHRKPVDREFTELAEIIVDMASGWDKVERIFLSKGAEFGADAVYVLEKLEYTREIYQPHECHFSFEHSYPPGYSFDDHYFGPGHFRHRDFRFRFPQRYYYCYGGRYTTEKSGYLKVIGVAIKWLPEE